VKPKLIGIVGPTAAGKTALALRLAKQCRGAVVSADSRQVYAGMNIGTATPLHSASGGAQGGQAPHDALTPDTFDGVDHYLLNIRQPNSELTLAEWQRAARRVMRRIVDEGATPLLTGGSMLYVDSIIRNFAIPAVPAQRELRARLSRRGVKELFDELMRRDPAARAFVEPHNTRRIIRALEVIEVTNRPFSATRQQREPDFKVVTVGIFPGWDELETTIRRRAQAMVKEGLLEERERLVSRFGADLPLLKTINYAQVPDVEAMTRANLRYARRQMSWWRGRDDIAWFSDPAAVPQI
jgi:tRNA dimethylallyltransferase